MDGGDKPTRDAAFYEVNRELEGPERFPIPERGVRTKKWLYVRTQDHPKLLIDLKADPEEKTNLLEDPAYRQQRDRLEVMLLEHMERTADDWSAESVFPPKGFLSHEEKSKKQKRLIKEAIWEN